MRHEGRGAAVAVLLRDADEGVKVGVVDGFLVGEVELEGAAREEAIEALAVLDVRFTVEEDPVVRAEDLVRDVDDAGFDVARSVEDPGGHVPCGRYDDESVYRW